MVFECGSKSPKRNTERWIEILTVLTVLLHSSSQLYKCFSHSLVFSLKVRLVFLRLIRAGFQHVFHSTVHVVGECVENADLMFQLGLVNGLVRGLDGHEHCPTQQWIFLCLPLACLPSLFVRTGQKVLPHLRSGENWVPTDSIDEALQLVHPMVYKLVLISTWKHMKNIIYCVTSNL